MEELRHDHDELASVALERILQIAPHQKPYKTLLEYRDSEPELAALWRHTLSVPDWVDWSQIERGQKVFYRYAVANIVGFALQGFIGEISAATGPAEVLVRTGGLSQRNLMRRFWETFCWLIEVTTSLQSIQPLGRGHTSTVRVRLLHAQVRNRILSLAGKYCGYFDTSKYGTPVNTYDSILTMTFFCCNPIWVQLPRLGIKLAPREQEDFVALYRYLSYILGIPDGQLSSPVAAKATMETIHAHNSSPTAASRTIVANFFECVVDRAPLYVSRGFLEAASRFMNGDKLCDELDLGKPGFINQACFTVFRWMIRLLTVVQGCTHAGDAFFTQYTRKQLFGLLNVGPNRSTTFDFQYNPQPMKNGSRTSSPSSTQFSLFSRRFEWLLFAIFISVSTIAICGVSVVLFFGFKGVKQAITKVYF